MPILIRLITLPIPPGSPPGEGREDVLDLEDRR